MCFPKPCSNLLKCSLDIFHFFFKSDTFCVPLLAAFFTNWVVRTADNLFVKYNWVTSSRKASESEDESSGNSVFLRFFPFGRWRFSYTSTGTDRCSLLRWFRGRFETWNMHTSSVRQQTLFGCILARWHLISNWSKITWWLLNKTVDWFEQCKTIKFESRVHDSYAWAWSYCSTTHACSWSCSCQCVTMFAATSRMNRDIYNEMHACSWPDTNHTDSPTYTSEDERWSSEHIMTGLESIIRRDALCQSRLPMY